MADAKTVMELEIQAQGLAKLKSEMSGLSSQVTKLSKSAGKAKGGLSGLGQVPGIGRLATGMGAATVAIAGFNVALQGMLDKETALADFSAITGVAGEDLDKFGDIAVELSNEFGTDAVQNINSFKSILSRLGPDIAQSSEAVQIMGENVNILAKASGLDATQSMDALTTAVLQFGVDLSDPVAAAKEMGVMMNVMAAASKAGASEVPDLSVALTQVGATAKNLNVSFEETNALLETLALGGKKGAEAGVALRNIFAKMAGPTKKAQKILAKLGLSATDLGETLTTEGGNAAILQLKERLLEIESPAEQAAALVKLFGTENLAAAQTVINNTAATEKYTIAVTGTNTALEQAAVNMDTNREALNRFTNLMTNTGVKALENIFDGLGNNIAQFEKMFEIIDRGSITADEAWDSVKSGLRDVLAVVTFGISEFTGLAEAIGLVDTAGDEAKKPMKEVSVEMKNFAKGASQFTGLDLGGSFNVTSKEGMILAGTIGLTAEETEKLAKEAEAANKKLTNTAKKVIPPLVGSLGAMNLQLQIMNDELINRTVIGSARFNQLSGDVKRLSFELSIAREKMAGTFVELPETIDVATASVMKLSDTFVDVQGLLQAPTTAPFMSKLKEDTDELLDSFEKIMATMQLFGQSVGAVFGALGGGAEDMKTALKGIGTSVITLAEGMLLSATAAAWAKGTFTFGASLAADIPLLALAVTALEGAKAAINSLAVGTTNVPSDQLAQLHQGEMVIPKTFAQGIRDGDFPAAGGDFFRNAGQSTQVVIAGDRTRGNSANGARAVRRRAPMSDNARIA